MDYYYFAEVSPERFDPAVMIVLAVVAWGALYISLRREAVRARKEERLERERMAQLRHNYLHHLGGK